MVSSGQGSGCSVSAQGWWVALQALSTLHVLGKGERLLPLGQEGADMECTPTRGHILHHVADWL